MRLTCGTMYIGNFFWNTNLSAKMAIARYYRRKIVFLVLLVIFIFVVYTSVQRSKKSAQLTKLIESTMGTRITAVKLKPDLNTTLVQPVHTCKNHTLVIIMISSLPQNIQRRVALRWTWFEWSSKSDGVEIRPFFFVGLPVDRDLTNLKNEAAEYGDLIVEDIEENYYLQSVKTLRMLKWVLFYCPETKFIVKTDDGMFLNVPNLVSHINSIPKTVESYIGGELHMNEVVNRNPDSKLFSPITWWSQKFYPSYVGGGILIIASNIVSRLLHYSLLSPIFHLEDVYVTGMIGFDKLGIKPYNIANIINIYPTWFERFYFEFFYDSGKDCIGFRYDDDFNLLISLYKSST